MTSKKKALRDLLLGELETGIPSDADFPILDNMSPDEKAKLTKGDLFIKVLMNKALTGDSKSIQEILDRLYGKAPQHITQDVNVNSYTNFLEELALLPDAEFEAVEETTTLPPPPPEEVEVIVEETPDIMEDFGL